MFDQIPGPCIPLKLTHKINHHTTPIITNHTLHCLYWSILNKCLYCTRESRISSYNKYLLPKNLGLKRLRLFFSHVMNCLGWGAPGQRLSSAPAPKATLTTADPGSGKGHGAQRFCWPGWELAHITKGEAGWCCVSVCPGRTMGWLSVTATHTV